MNTRSATVGCALAMGLAVASLASIPAQAALIGDTVTAQAFGDVDEGPANAVVGAGLEFDFFSVDIDIDAFTALFQSNLIGQVATGQTVALTGLDLGSPIIGLDLLGSGGLSLAPVLAFTGTSASVALLSGTQISSGAFVEIEFLTATQVIPLPAALPLMLGGLGIFGLVGLRRRRHPAA